MTHSRAAWRPLIMLFAALAAFLALTAGCGSESSDSTASTPSPAPESEVASEPASTDAASTDAPAPEATATTPEPSPTPVSEIDTPTQPPADAVTASATSAAGATDTPEITEAPVSVVTLAPVAQGFTLPLYVTHAFDERLFVVEQAGQIKIVEGGQVLAQPFLDITSRVGSTGLEQGLLSVAFHPAFQENGRFFVDYTNLQGNTVVAEYQVDETDGNFADPGSEQILLSVDQPYGNHNGGQLQFGPDGYLYIGMGDGGSAGDPLNNAQDTSTLLGALLRLDVDNPDPSSDRLYSIPADNPFVGTDGARDEIWAYGLRNPWRFSFDRQTDDLYIADVGQNLWEEVNFEGAGAGGGLNYGWNIMEANTCYGAGSCDSSGFVLPVAEYSHELGSCSVTGGYVYRGSAYPALSGNYFYADFCSGILWSLFDDPQEGWQATELFRSGMFVSSFGEGWDGELYLVDRIGGQVLQLQP